MKLELAAERWVALPLQVVALSDGVVLKRGRVEVKVLGPAAADAVRALVGT
jgi:hypothetical protein